MALGKHNSNIKIEPPNDLAFDPFQHFAIERFYASQNWKTELEKILNRATPILKKQAANTIQQAGKQLLPLLHKKRNELILAGGMSESLDELPEDTFALLQRFCRAEDISHLGLPISANEAEIYAIAAVTLVDLSCQPAKPTPTDDSSWIRAIEQNRQISITQMLFEAKEIIAYAEQRYKVSEQKRDSRNQGYSAAKELKCKFIAFYYASDYPTIKKAAEKFYDQYVERCIEANIDYVKWRLPIRVLSKALNDFRNKKLDCGQFQKNIAPKYTSTP